jgi:hypothetical protein
MKAADFSGWATKAGLKCTDGRTITPDAFKSQNGATVPLVWQHGHNDVENVLGHAVLEHRAEGVYAYCYFNETPKAAHAKNLVHHRDITQLSIWANKLVERAGNVLHGVIREVSLVLAGANPGAVIENISLQHSDGSETPLEDEAIIYTNEHLEHSDDSTDDDDTDTDTDLEHADEATVQEVYDSMTEEQQTVLHFLVGQALENAQVQHSDNMPDNPNETIEDVINTMTPKQQDVLHYLVSEALASVASHSDTTNTNDDPAIHGDLNPEGNEMTNVFEKGTDQDKKNLVLSHDDMKTLQADAIKMYGGSLKQAVQEYALHHGINDIDLLFPDAKLVTDTPEFLKRRTEWVATFLGGCRKSPFNRIRTQSADLTFDSARAKGYVKGTMKKEEFFGISQRITTPTTVYKKQKLDRDDIIDITDFNVVAWLKGEMRFMLEEEIARAILVGDGRDVSDPDKINEQNIRPIAKDNELFTTVVNVNIDDANSSVTEIVDQIILHRQYYKGTGQPTFYTTETYIAKFMLLKDSTGRRIYTSLEDLRNELRVAAIVPVEPIEDIPNLIGVLVNPIDYTIGSTSGGETSMFDDFDIDYNQYKYLIETRMCGALTKLKSAMVVMKVASTLVSVTPTEPTWNSTTFVVTIPSQTGVVYKNGAGTTLTAGAQAALSAGTTLVVNATPDSGYYFPSSEDDSWSFSRPA